MSQQIELKTPSRVEVEDIFQALLGMLSNSPAKQMALAEPAAAYSHLLVAALNGKLLTFGDFAILFDIGSPWHTRKLVLIEEIIVRFRKRYGNTVESAVAQLEVIARDQGCAAIAAGDTQVGIMGPRYLAAGFTTLGSQFYKEIA